MLPVCFPNQVIAVSIHGTLITVLTLLDQKLITVATYLAVLIIVLVVRILYVAYDSS